ncbi:MAG: undecaprenyl-diphosphate phosphatase [Nitrospirae bacterium]|nr:undecaprenyl-diphosphate phosphatase [Nitrospirota bacterium]
MFEALILGIVQGLTEFLPVSSTAHLILFPWFLGWSGEVDSLTFDVALHAGTLLSVVVCFWKDWLEIFRRKHRLLGMLVLASVPAGVSGILLDDFIEERLRSPLVISVSLVVFGIYMLASERSVKEKRLDNLSFTDALFIGVSQAVALIPGVSRSGITISTGLFRGMEREMSARFSFLLSTPVIAGATLLHAKKMIFGHETYNLQLFGAGFLASAVTGFIAIRFLLYYLKNHSVNVFAYYRFGLAVVIMVGIWLRA